MRGIQAGADIAGCRGDGSEDEITSSHLLRKYNHANKYSTTHRDDRNRSLKTKCTDPSILKRRTLYTYTHRRGRRIACYSENPTTIGRDINFASTTIASTYVVHADAPVREVGVVQFPHRPRHVVAVGKLSHTATFRDTQYTPQMCPNMRENDGDGGADGEHGRQTQQTQERKKEQVEVQMSA